MALECYDEQDEGTLVEMCINNIIPEYRVYLENLNITQFTKLIEATRKTSLSVKAPVKTWKPERKPLHQALTTSNRERRPLSGIKRKEREEYLAVPCSEAELHAILDQWFGDGFIRPREPKKSLTEEEKTHPRFCRYHQFVGHPTTHCQFLKRIIERKISDGTLEIASAKQGIDKDPLP